MSNLRFPQINQVAVSGRLTHDPESRMGETGSIRVTFTLAVNLTYKDRNNEWQQEATYVPVVVWGKLAEAVAHNLQRGKGVFLTGRLKSKAVETSDGNKTVLEIVARNIQFLDKKAEEAE